MNKKPLPPEPHAAMKIKKIWEILDKGTRNGEEYFEKNIDSILRQIKRIIKR